MGVPVRRGEEGRYLAAPLGPDGGLVRVISKLGHDNMKTAAIFKVRHMQCFVYLSRMLAYL